LTVLGFFNYENTSSLFQIKFCETMDKLKIHVIFEYEFRRWINETQFEISTLCLTRMWLINAQ